MVFNFSSGNEALKAIDSGNIPDLIVTDLNMPGIDGVLFINEVRARNLAAEIIIASGRLSSDDLIQASKLGVKYVLNKPFTFVQMRAVILEIASDRQEPELDFPLEA